MSYAQVTISAREVLLDALEALAAQRDALVLVGAQAICLYTRDVDVAIATSTKDSDVVVLPALLALNPRLEDALTAAGGA